MRTTTVVGIMTGNADTEVSVHGGKNVPRANRTLLGFRAPFESDSPTTWPPTIPPPETER